MEFEPREVLFSPAARCNLKCPHCGVARTSALLSPKDAIKFLGACRSIGIKRVGFTGGEPFLSLNFLLSVTRFAVEKSFLFGRIMTNGTWWRTAAQVESSLRALHEAGYDGDITVSFDAFHGRRIGKVMRFIEAAALIWNRPDVVSLACVFGLRDGQTLAMLRSLAAAFGARLRRAPGGRLYIRGRVKGRPLFVRIEKIGFSSAGKAPSLKYPWTGRWFKEDYCKGPGNVFLVMPDGDVKPCCGYGSDSKALTIGNIKKDTPSRILKKAEANRFVSTVFNSGLVSIRKRLEASGVKFPWKTADHCFFCHYILRNVPKGALERCLDD